MMKKRIVLIPKKISISVDSKIQGIHYFSLGECLSDNVFEYENGEINVELNVVPNSSSVFKIEAPIYSTKDFKIKNRLIYFCKKYHFLSFKILIENIDSNDIKIFVNKQYWKLLKFKIENLYPVGIQISDLLLLRAIKNDSLIIYGASLHNIKSNNAFLIMSLPAAGKTNTVFNLLSKENYQYLGEDMSYYDSNSDELYCVPFSSSWGHHKKGSFKYANVINIFGKDKVREKSKLDRIYLLEYSEENKITKINNNGMSLNKLLNLQRNAFSCYKNQLFRTYDYFCGSLGIENLYRKEISIFEKMLKDTEVYLVLSNNHDNFYKIIYKNEEDLLLDPQT